MYFVGFSFHLPSLAIQDFKYLMEFKSEYLDFIAQIIDRLV